MWCSSEGQGPASFIRSIFNEPSKRLRMHHRLLKWSLTARRSSAPPPVFRRRLLSSTTTSTTKRDFTPLQQMLPHVNFNYNPYELRRHGHGESYHAAAPPEVVVTPQSTSDVVAILDYACRQRVPVVPFGAGTSLEGHVHAIHGGISLDMAAFTALQLPDPALAYQNGSAAAPDDGAFPDHYAIVGAGVTRLQLNRALRHTGLEFVVDPGADATLAGMVSTGASGTSTVMYGSMRENILELECVVPLKEGATIIKAGTRTLKNSAGYDLVSLLCGAEGTLGVITSVTVKLHPICEHVVAAVCQFQTLMQAASVVAALKQSQMHLSRCELLDATAMQAFNAYKSNGMDGHVFSSLPERPTLFLEFQGYSEDSLQEQISVAQSLCGDFDGSNFQFASGTEERKALWSARHDLYYASIALRTKLSSSATASGDSPRAIVTDACVPLSQLARVITETVDDMKRFEVIGTCFGHAGDGNFHVILPVLDDDSQIYREKLQMFNDNLIKRTLAAGGTCSGEHGIGYGKMKYLKQQYGSGAVETMKAIKQSLDPYNIMNPGKVVNV